MENVLIPTDFSDNAQKAAEYAVCLFGSKVKYTVINSYELPHSGATMLISIGDILRKDSEILLEKEKLRISEIHPQLADNLEFKAIMGAPNVAIKKEAVNADVVVMGTAGASGLKEVFIGSVASNTLSDVECPVIAVPENADLEVPKKILFAADDKCLVSGKLPEGLSAIANKFGAEVFVLNVVPKGEISHVGNSAENSKKAVGVFEDVKHSIHFIEDEEVNHGIATFLAENQMDMLAMITRKNDLFSRLFGSSNTKAMMMHTNIPLVAFH